MGALAWGSPALSIPRGPPPLTDTSNATHGSGGQPRENEMALDRGACAWRLRGRLSGRLGSPVAWLRPYCLPFMDP